MIIYGRHNDKSIVLKEKLTKSNPCIEIKTVDSVEEAVKNSKIIITTTSSKIPLVKGEWLSKGQHITAMGADDIYKNEIDSNCFERADNVFIDSLELNKKYGEYSHAINALPKLIDKTIEFGKAFQNRTLSDSQNKITIAKLVGVGIQDLAASIVLMNKLKTNATSK